MIQIIADSYRGTKENPLPIGKRRENNARTVVFKALKDVREIYDTTGRWEIVCRRPNEKTSYIVRESWESTEGYACWDVCDEDVEFWGEGEVELRFYPHSDSDLYKSQIWVTRIENSLVEDGDAPDSPYLDILDQTGAYANAAKEAARVATSAVSGEKAERIAADDALQAEINETQAMVGSPLVASLASQMTNQDHIYVYTGSETGYTAGHWYYYNGSAWTDGGVYNSVAVATDKTLTVEDKAADGKAVGDKFDLIEADLERKANVDGYYENLSSGNANQLISSTFVEDNEPYSFRTSGGSADIGDREFDKLIGGTVAWNQLVSNGNFSDGSTDWITSRCAVTTSNNVAEMTVTVDGDIYYDHFMSMIAGHKYLATIELYTSSSTVGYFGLRVYYNGTNNFVNASLTKDSAWHVLSKIISNTETSTSSRIRVYSYVPSGTSCVGDVCKIKNAMVFDLTQMFGSTIADYIYSLETAHEGDGVAYFRKLFPKSYYPYDAGSLLSVKTSAHEMTGFNQWDEVWELGSIQNNGTNYASSTNIRSKNYIPAISSSEYCISINGITSEIYAYVFCYDTDKAFISKATILTDGSNHLFTTPEKCAYIRFYVNQTYGTTYHDDICINISWDGERDGEYEPYVLNSYPLEPDLELRGMVKKDSSNKLYYDGDTYESDGTVTRKYGIVDLGTLSWTYSNNASAFGTQYFKDLIRKNVNDSTRPDYLICSSLLTPSAVNGGLYGSKDKIICVNSGADVYVSWLATTDASTFTTAISGVYLVYELAEPTTETADPFTSPQIVDDFGTETYVDNRNVQMPVGHETKYAANLKAKLEMAPNSPGDGNGEYVVRQTNGINEYIPLGPIINPIDSRVTNLEGLVDSIGAGKYGVSGVGQSANAQTRIWDSVGMVAQVGTDGDNSNVRNDFDKVKCFARRKCVGNWVLDESETHAKFIVNAYEGDSNYAEDGSMGDYVAVECPRAYYYFKDGTLGISSFQHPGWEVFDIFKRNHSDRPEDQLDFYYMPAYALAKKNGHAVSLPGFDNEQGDYAGLVTAAKTYDNSDISRYAILQPAAVNFYEWALYTVEFANQDCQGVMRGCANLQSADSTACVFIDSTHVLITGHNDGRVAGQYIAITTSTGHTNVSYQATHKITDIYRSDASGNSSSSGGYDYATVEDLGKNYFTYTVGTTYYIAGRPYRAGSTSNVTTSSGSPISNTNGYYPMKYRGRENVFGNQYKTSMDLFNERKGTGDSDYYLDWYLMTDMSNYSSNPDAAALETSRFEKLGVQTLHANYVSGWIKSKKYDAKYHDIWIPFETTGAGASTYFCDYASLVNSSVVRSARFGGYWYTTTYDGFSFLYGNFAPSPGHANFGGDLFFLQ